MRIASYNVENLFNRAKALDQRTWAAGRPILEAFFHARYMLEMAVKYGKELDRPPNCLPSGWAAFLYLYDLR